MRVITRDQVKTQLGIVDSSYDTRIDAKLDIIDAKVKQICNNKFNYRFAVDMTSGETTVNAYALYQLKDAYPSGVMNDCVIRDVSKSLEIGMQIEGDNIPTGTYITNVYKSGSLDILGAETDLVYVELSAAVTDDEEGVIVTGGISVAYLDVIAKGVWWMIDNTSTTIVDGSWTSKSYGSVSVSRDASSVKMDGKSGMPAWFVQGLPRYR